MMKKIFAAMVVATFTFAAPAAAEPASTFIPARGMDVPGLLAATLAGKDWMMVRDEELLDVFEKDGVRLTLNYAGGAPLGFVVKVFANSVKDGKSLNADPKVAAEIQETLDSVKKTTESRR